MVYLTPIDLKDVDIDEIYHQFWDTVKDAEAAFTKYNDLDKLNQVETMKSK